jgi:hypothetical protein
VPAGLLEIEDVGQWLAGFIQGILVDAFFGLSGAHTGEPIWDLALCRRRCGRRWLTRRSRSRRLFL